MAASEIVADVVAPAFAVVAKWNERPLVRHVALLYEETTLSPGKHVRAYEMGPPLRAGQPDAKGESLRGIIAPDLVGWIDLTEEQTRAISNNIEEIRRLIPHPTTRSSASPEAGTQYCARPAYSMTQQGYLRCSCVGFVLYAYRDVVTLVKADDESLPDVPLSVIERIWQGLSNRRAECGLEGSGPWKVVLPGYVVHALDGESLPHTAVSGQEAFPSA
jgi:hypothetical protein